MKKQNKRRKTLKYVDEELWLELEKMAKECGSTIDFLIAYLAEFSTRNPKDRNLNTKFNEIKKQLQKQSKNN